MGLSLLPMPRPLMPVGDRRVTVTLTLAPTTLDTLDVAVQRAQMSRGRVIDLIVALLWERPVKADVDTLDTLIVRRDR